jgi:signal transduction histidine kinase
VTQSRNELLLLQEQITRQNAELAAANLELGQLSELKSQFVAIAAHELRTPLTSMIGYLEMLQSGTYGPLTEAQQRRLGIVYDGGQRLLSITQNLLDVTRLESGRLDLVLTPSDLSSLIELVVDEQRPLLLAKGHHLTTDLQPGLPPVLCDATRTAQILGNLLGNAVKYTLEGGRIEIGASLSREVGFVQIWVSDTGVGVSAKDQTRLFSRFFRAESAAEAKASGSGLGLYITKSLVELHGGRVWLQSELDQGSTFFVTLPIAD